MSDDIDWLSNSSRWHAFRFGEVERNPSLPGTDLARARSRAHRAFDPIWKMRMMSRTAAYIWLAEQMGLPAHNCHMGMFNAAQCERVVELCDAFMKERAARKRRRR